MALQELIQQIASGWPTYHQKERVDKNDSVYRFGDGSVSPSTATTRG